MRRIKIFITIFVLYEFVMSTILQIPGTCNALFNHGFCEASNFKYFLMCVMVPGLLILFFWWMPDIARPFCKNKCQCDETNSEQKPIQKAANEIISHDDLERIVSTAIVLGIQKFATLHPKTSKFLDNIVDALKNTKKIKKK